MIDRNEYLDDYGTQVDPLFDIIDGLEKQLEAKDKEIAKLESCQAMTEVNFGGYVEDKQNEVEILKDALADAINGLAYIKQAHGELYGVGFDRVEGYRKLLTKGVIG